MISQLWVFYPATTHLRYVALGEDRSPILGQLLWIFFSSSVVIHSSSLSLCQQFQSRSRLGSSSLHRDSTRQIYFWSCTWVCAISDLLSTPSRPRHQHVSDTISPTWTCSGSLDSHMRSRLPRET
jgi:hypothetical protein